MGRWKDLLGCAAVGLDHMRDSLTMIYEGAKIQ